MPNSSEDSPEIEFWHCKNCEHTWMSEEQQKALAEKLPVTR
jgi:DNA-directed RNA polymerase subunit M/transcription elongation factor TFIIS